MVYISSLGSRASTILFKYLGQAIRTARILHRERPDAVFVMTPPLFAALPAFWYARRHKASVVLDAHSAAFMHRRWRYFQRLQFALCRRAAATLVHNDHIANLVRSRGAQAIIVRDVPIAYRRIETFPRPEAFTVAVVCSFNYDEPVEAILGAAARLPDVRFFITGNPRHLQHELKARLPSNAVLTGFLSAEAYGGLLQGADAVMTLTTRDHTMLRGAYEAIYQGTPVLVSDWPVLRDAFDEGSVHVANDADAIADGIQRLRSNLPVYREGAERLRTRKLAAWRATREAILQSITRER
jgi:glycosyltransferase involved in cell wall biosynthesis